MLPLRHPHVDDRRLITPTSIPTESVSLPLFASRAALLLRRALFPPQDTDRDWRYTLCLLAQRLNPTRRKRANPRLIKRKMPKWHVKRARHHTWPQPTRLPAITTIRP